MVGQLGIQHPFDRWVAEQQFDVGVVAAQMEQMYLDILRGII